MNKLRWGSGGGSAFEVKIKHYKILIIPSIIPTIIIPMPP